MTHEAPVLTIDGPSGAGKGTISRAVARALGWHYLDSGAIYRSLAIAVMRSHLGLDDEAGIAHLAATFDPVFRCNDDLTVLVDGDDVTDAIATESCGRAASTIAAYPRVRAALLLKQRGFRQPPGLVADGRDMGTVVFPEADCKIFLTARADIRAKRRYKQLKEKGIDVRLSEVMLELADRDRRDRERASAPLVQADDAVLIDTSELAIDTVVWKVLDLVGA